MIIHESSTKDWPDTGEPCCMGSAVYGPGRCTCWEPVYDIEAVHPWDGSTPKESPTMCLDCAYRKGSPEKSGQEGFAGDEDMLMDIVEKGQRFYCHQGVRKVVRYKHPCGMVVAGHPADYEWRMACFEGEEFPIKADGSAVEICGGWCKQRKRFLANEPKKDEVEA